MLVCHVSGNKDVYFHGLFLGERGEQKIWVSEVYVQTHFFSASLKSFENKTFHYSFGVEAHPDLQSFWLNLICTDQCCWLIDVVDSAAVNIHMLHCGRVDMFDGPLLL